MRTAAWEIAPQIAPRDCSKEAVGEGQYIRFWWRGILMQLSTHFTKGFLLATRSCHHERIQCFSRYEETQGLGSLSQFLKIPNYLKPYSTSFPGAQSASLSTPKSLRERWRSAAAAAEAGGRRPCCCSVAGRCSWQVPISSWQANAN